MQRMSHNETIASCFWTVRENRLLPGDCGRLLVETDSRSVPPPRPGQFYMVRLGHGSDVGREEAGRLARPSPAERHPVAVPDGVLARGEEREDGRLGRRIAVVVGAGGIAAPGGPERGDDREEGSQGGETRIPVADHGFSGVRGNVNG